MGNRIRDLGRKITDFYYLWLRRRYSRSTIKTKKSIFVLFCAYLIVPLPPKQYNATQWN